MYPQGDALPGTDTYSESRAKYGEWLILRSAILSEQLN
jgi:hypothetical protein